MPIFRDTCRTRRTGENALLGTEGGHYPGFFLDGTLAVRFQRLRRANAMRSQIDHSAKAELTFSFRTQWELVLPRSIPSVCSSMGCLLRSPLIPKLLAALFAENGHGALSQDADDRT